MWAICFIGKFELVLDCTKMKIIHPIPAQRKEPQNVASNALGDDKNAYISFMIDNTNWTPFPDDNILGLTDKNIINEYEAKGLAISMV